MHAGKKRIISLSNAKGSSFLKKRTKKLLSVSAGTEFYCSNSVPAAREESFLLLFFKKEALGFIFPLIASPL